MMKTLSITMIVQVLLVLVLSSHVVTGQMIAGLEVVDSSGIKIKYKIGRALDIQHLGHGYDIGLRIKLKDNASRSNSLANVTAEVILGSGFLGSNDVLIQLKSPFILKSNDTNGQYSLKEYLQTGGFQKSIKIKIYDENQKFLDEHAATFYVIHPQFIELVKRSSTVLITNEGEEIPVDDGTIAPMKPFFADSTNILLNIISSFTSTTVEKADSVNYYFENEDDGEVRKYTASYYDTKSSTFIPLDYFKSLGTKSVTVEAIINGTIQFSEVIDFELVYVTEDLDNSSSSTMTRAVHTNSGANSNSIDGSIESCYDPINECPTVDNEIGTHMNESNEYNGCSTKCIKVSLIQSKLNEGYVCGPCAMSTISKRSILLPDGI